jgi:predicted metal-binding membrane protein
MSAGMPMPGGWTMSMAWMVMPGQTRLGALVAFIGMWVLMMVAMMLPSLVPMLASYRQTLRAPNRALLDRLTAVAGAGYFLVWALIGVVAYPLGVLLALAEMRWMAVARAVPAATGGVLMIAGCVQLSPSKALWLCRCRDAAGGSDLGVASAGNAWRRGIRFGLDCSLCCSGLMAILLVGGVMDLGVMALVAAAITAERFSPNPRLTARAIGVLVLAAGATGMALGLGRV